MALPHGARCPLNSATPFSSPQPLQPTATAGQSAGFAAGRLGDQNVWIKVSEDCCQGALELRIHYGLDHPGIIKPLGYTVAPMAIAAPRYGPGAMHVEPRLALVMELSDCSLLQFLQATNMQVGIGHTCHQLPLQCCAADCALELRFWHSSVEALHRPALYLSGPIGCNQL